MISPNKITTPPIKSLKINGFDLADFTMVVPDKAVYSKTLTYVTRYFKIYCGLELPVIQNGDEKRTHELRLGKTDRNADRELEKFETEISFDGENLILMAGNETFAAQVFDRFLVNYLSKAGDIVIELPTDKPVYRQKNLDFLAAPNLLNVQDRIVRSMLKLQAAFEYDYLNGIFWSYQHSGYTNNFDEARQKGIRVTNCVIVMNWVLKDAGLYSHGTFNHLYNGTVGYVANNPEIKEAMTTGNFEIIETEKTIRELRDENILLPGDIIFFRDYNADHNQIVFDGDNAIDGGRGNCFVVECGAPFRRFLGPNKCMDARVGLIFRSVDAQ